MAVSNATTRAVKEFFVGATLLFRGMRVWATAPRLMWAGILPALIVGVALLAVLIIFGINLKLLAELITPFANSWSEPFRSLTRFLASLSLLAIALVIMIYTYTAAVLAVGQPFYERIWKHVENRFGPLPERPQRGSWSSFWQGLGVSIRIFIPTVLTSIALLPLGLIPVVGQILVPTLGAIFVGWFLTLELVGFAFDGRGMSFLERRTVMRKNRASAIGFGAVTYLIFLIPLGAVVMMPAAVGGATLLSRRALGERSDIRTT